MESYSSYNKISLPVFFASFFFLVFRNSDIHGYQAFFIGFSPGYFSAPQFLFPWLANFIFWGSLLTKAGGDARILLAVLSVVLAGTVLFIDEMPKYVLEDDQKVPQFGAGYILWLSSFTINLVGTIRDRIILKKKRTALED